MRTFLKITFNSTGIEAGSIYRANVRSGRTAVEQLYIHIKCMKLCVRSSAMTDKALTVGLGNIYLIYSSSYVSPNYSKNLSAHGSCILPQKYDTMKPPGICSVSGCLLPV